MSRRAFNITAALLAVACVLILWRRSARDEPSTVPGPAAAPQHHEVRAPVALPAIRPTAADATAAKIIADFLRALGRRDARRNEAVLTFRDDDAFQRFLARAQAAGLPVLARVDALRSARVRFEDPAAVRADIDAHAGDYADAGANPLITIPQPPPAEERPAVDQVAFGNQTLAFLGAQDNADWGRGVTVAVLDTGVAADRTFGARLHALDIGLGTAPGSGSADGHGTGVAALVAGAAPDAGGVAPAANILSIRVTDTDTLSDLFTIAKGIVAAVDAGAKVVNISLGGYATGAILDAALAYAGERGAAVVAAAGNDQAARLAWPAADPRVISVGAVDAAGQQVSFSNSSEQLQVSAPGYRVQTAWLEGQRAFVSGTSASSPLVAGAIAAVMSQNPGLAPASAARAVLATTNDAGTAGADPVYGSGILNAGWAMHRQDTTYVDTAVANHLFDPGKNQLQVLVQNRSGRPVTGLTMEVTAGISAMKFNVPSLGPGETWTGRVPADPIALRNGNGVTFRTELVNPPGIEDRIPANNQRTTVVTPPKP